MFSQRGDRRQARALDSGERSPVCDQFDEILDIRRQIFRGTRDTLGLLECLSKVVRSRIISESRLGPLVTSMRKRRSNRHCVSIIVDEVGENVVEEKCREKGATDAQAHFFVYYNYTSERWKNCDYKTVRSFNLSFFFSASRRVSCHHASSIFVISAPLSTRVSFAATFYL